MHTLFQSTFLQIFINFSNGLRAKVPWPGWRIADGGREADRVWDRLQVEVQGLHGEAKA